MSLIAHWPLTDDLKDISVNNNHLVYVGSGSQITTTLDGKNWFGLSESRR